MNFLFDTFNLFSLKKLTINRIEKSCHISPKKNPRKIRKKSVPKKRNLSQCKIKEEKKMKTQISLKI